METPLLFSCRFCTFKCNTLKVFLQHRSHHRHLNSRFPCGIGRCRTILNTESCLRSHVIRHHNIHVSELKSLGGTKATNSYGKFVCSVNYCKQEVDSCRALVKHMKYHICKGETVNCPLPGCQKRYSVVSSLKGHISRNHRGVTILEQPANVPCQNENLNVFCQVDAVTEYEPMAEDEPETCENNEDLLLQSMAQFYMKLEFKNLVPERTVQYICTEIQALKTQSLNMVMSNLKIQLLNEGLSNEKIATIVSEILNPIQKQNTELRSSHCRKKVYKKLFPFVAPKKMKLQNDNFFYYVPIQETLLALFKDKSQNFVLESPQVSTDDVLRDFTDGTVFSQNEFFKNNPKALRLILYQDAFDVCCPIGGSKLKHKVVGVYLSVGNLPDFVRSHIDSIQLVALCKDKELDHNIVFGKLVEDLKKLESEGLDVPGHGKVKAGLAFIAGDNLGSHSLGGFYENFSKSIFFCRYCEVQRQDFLTDGGHYFKFPRRTIDSYNQALNARQRKLRKGLHFNSRFNTLNNFHVCLPGLPPCLGHDILEGFGSHDYCLFIHYFISKGWFTYDMLNDRIETFNYSSEDRRDKPGPFSKDQKKLAGGAWCSWTFMKLFPLMIEDMVLDKHDKVWKNLIFLIEIIEILCAPSIHVAHLAYLQDIIHEYLDLRQENFKLVELRPKHHYLCHYPELILAFGPLLRVWTLRFESKHTFFTRASRSSKNFINLLMSFSNRHELLQCFLRSGADLQSLISPVRPCEFKRGLYSVEINEAVLSSHLPDYLQECASVVYKGTTYKKGDVVVVDQNFYQCGTKFGRINLVLFDGNEKLYFLVEMLETTFLPHLRVYRLGGARNYVCINVTELLSPFPLYSYKVHGHVYLKLKHGIVSKPC